MTSSYVLSWLPETEKTLLSERGCKTFKQACELRLVSIVMLRHAGAQPWESFIVRDHSW